MIEIGFHTDAFNAGNIRACIESEGPGGPMIERSLAWVRQELQAAVEAAETAARA